MNSIHDAIQKFRGKPWTIQWLIVVGIGILLFRVYIDGIAPLATDWQVKADAIERKVADIRKINNNLAQMSRTMEGVIQSIGRVEAPTSEHDGAIALQDVVNSVIARHRAGSPNFVVRTRGKLPKTALAALKVVKGKTVERLTGDLKFEATPEVALAIIAELESSTEIELVDSVRITRDVQGRVKVQLTLEAWVISASDKRGIST